MMQIGSQLAEPSELYAALAQQGHDADAALEPGQRADSAAYGALVTERLGAALLYAWWVEEENYEIIRGEYAVKLPVPLCYYLPWSMRRKIHSQLARRGCVERDVAYARGEAALDALSVRYGSRAFFHGAAPSGVDAIAFGFLTAVLRPPLPADQLRRALLARPNLVAFCERMSAAYFGEIPTPALPEHLAEGGVGIPPRKSVGAETADASGDAEAARVGGGEAKGKTTRTAKQQRFRQRSRNALIGAAASAIAYALATDMMRRKEVEVQDGEGEEQ